MATEFSDLGQHFDPALVLPINGRRYRIEPPSAEVGLWLEAVMTGMALAATASDEQVSAQARSRLGDLPRPKSVPEGASVTEVVLGPAMAAMRADEVPWPHIRHAGTTALLYATVGEEAAEQFWQSGGRPEAPAPNGAAPTTSTPSTRTAGASTTTSPGSGSGTSSQMDTRPRSERRGRGRRSRGGRS